MPWQHGVFHDFFTPQERAQVTALQDQLDIAYSVVTDFETILLDGTFTLAMLQTLVVGLTSIQATKHCCACAQKSGPQA